MLIVICSIIFVHGLGSDPDTTWRARKSGTHTAGASQPTPTPHGMQEDDVCWVTDFLPHDFPTGIRQSSRVYYYNHDFFWQTDAIATRLWNLSHNMLVRISSEIRKTKEVGQPAAQLHAIVG